ncbi:hypothetical protein SO802_010842 [Lithocarpus litseifolius]|uniref:Uncharacterized protein n=1 Tax=Lithocarpus litseifolius TaxID=425828 RepID=A0AAW2DJI1_9ROSI
MTSSRFNPSSISAQKTFIYKRETFTLKNRASKARGGGSFIQHRKPANGMLMGRSSRSPVGDGPASPRYSDRLSPAVNNYLFEASRQEVRFFSTSLGSPKLHSTCNYSFHFLAAPLSPTSSYGHHKLQPLPPVPTTTKHRPYLRFRPLLDKSPRLELKCCKTMNENIK